MDLWSSKEWTNNIDVLHVRTGVRLRCDKNIDFEIKRSCKEFLAWLRRLYIFPIRVPIYIKESPYIKTSDGDKVSGVFFEPYDYRIEPYIRIAAGDYLSMKSEHGEDNALASILHSIAHELTHYFQWINGVELTEIGLERQAVRYADFIIDEYAKNRDHP